MRSPTPLAKFYRSQWRFRAIFRGDRREWFDLKLGWLLTDTIGAPYLVFDAEDEPRAALLRDYLVEARARYWAMRKSGAARDKRRLPQYLEAIRQVQRAHRARVELAIGYTMRPCAATLWHEDALFAFDMPPFREVAA